MLGIMVSVAILTFGIMMVDEDEVSLGKSVAFALGSSLVLGLALGAMVSAMGLIGLVVWLVLAPIIVTVGIWLVFNLDPKRAAFVAAVYIVGNIIYRVTIMYAFAA
ncbi:hypothetical protein LOC68_17275 [Blastopirellula sp. JC732]|uniref:Uncharacterized protein n=1 Tax=Blastopirellula sediminis TaxID=2894196 RepID=A0A9X1SH66_9BACT|nr:hypothetical protein [Blastopirellula sediminis]MCC9606554.1 hypothetical protein [Blastopirellula sediminis]MCC9630148.1 hypothetical protein [Blastopirellula sediminis]